MADGVADGVAKSSGVAAMKMDLVLMSSSSIFI